MIHWKEFGLDYSEAFKARWRRYRCEYANRDKVECMGYSLFGSDEPCDICKACDRSSVWEGSEMDEL